MTFPGPEDPKNWQGAYTKEQAHRDSQSRAVLFIVPLMLCFLTGFLYAYMYLARIEQAVTRASSDVTYALLALGVIFVSVLIFFVGIRTVFRFSGKFLEEFYQPPDGLEPNQVILYRLVGRPLLPPPLSLLLPFKYIIAKDGQLAKADEWPAWMTRNLGGPVLLIVFDGTALYLERGNRFSRVVGPGKKAPFLGFHETIKYVVDYRPKIKTDEITVWTKDGISIKVSIRMECQIGAPRSAETEKEASDSDPLIYRYDPPAIKKAVERNAVRRPSPDQPPSKVDWTENAWGQVTGIVPNYIGSRMLDDLLLAERNSGQILSQDTAQKLFGSLNAETQKFGVYITNLQINRVSYPSEVEEQRRLLWEAERQGVATIIDGQAKAFGIRAREKARAEAQKDLILAIADGLEKNKSKNFAEPLLLSLSGILDEGLQDPLMRAYLAKETLDTLSRLQGMLNKDY